MDDDEKDLIKRWDQKDEDKKKPYYVHNMKKKKETSHNNLAEAQDQHKANMDAGENSTLSTESSDWENKFKRNKG